MIYLLITIDYIINNFSSYSSYFFIIYLYNKEYRYFLLTGLILDLLIFNSFLINTLILSLIYIINIIFKDLNKDNIYNYIFINLFNYIVYILLINLIYQTLFTNILVIIGANLLINLIFYILSFRIKEVLIHNN